MKLHYKSTKEKTLRTESKITYVAMINVKEDNFYVSCEIFPKNLTNVNSENGSDFYESIEKLEIVKKALKLDGFVECTEQDYITHKK